MTDRDYDSRSRQTSVDHKTSANAVLSEEDYVYNGAGNLTSKTVDSVTTSYTYDDIDQLLTESRSGYSATYTYDANGNRASKTLNGTTETYTNDDADKLTQITSGGVTVKSFGYDSAGRTTSVTTSAGTTTLAYDYESRVTTITYPSTATNTFAYNGLDTRVSKVDSAGTATYKRDGAHVTASVVSDGFATYTPGISERRSSTTKYFGADRLGTNSLETNSSQVVTATKTYDAFGMPIGSTGSSTSPFGFAGQHGYQEDTDSGLKLLGHRYYDASTGRFLTRDPVKDGKNWNVYTGSNPAKRIDPSGLSFRDWLDEKWVEFSEWWSGTDVVGPGGEPVRVGGWPALLNKDRNALTLNETVHLNDHDDFEEYVNDKHWSDHEKVHIDQERNYHDGNAPKFFFQVVVQYALAFGHDGAPYEGEAEGGTTDPNRIAYPTGLLKVR